MQGLIYMPSKLAGECSRAMPLVLGGSGGKSEIWRSGEGWWPGVE
jgi:hypothetical protein